MLEKVLEIIKKHGDNYLVCKELIEQLFKKEEVIEVKEKKEIKKPIKRGSKLNG